MSPEPNDAGQGVSRKDEEGKKKKKKWKAYPLDHYRKALNSASHFLSKAVNSNADFFAVRLGRDDRRASLPYVSVSTLCGEVPLDGVDGGAAFSGMLVQAMDCLDGRMDRYDTPPSHEEIEGILSLKDSLSVRQETLSRHVNKRLRQIILADADGADVALTPLHAPGFNVVLQRRLDEEKKAIPKVLCRAKGILAFGGKNSQNIGVYIGSMHHPLWFKAPHGDTELRSAYRYHYWGIHLAFSPALARRFYDFRYQKQKEHGGVMPSAGWVRQYEESWLRRGVDEIKARAEEVCDLLVRHQDRLPGGALLDGKLPAFQRALIDPAQRVPGWKAEAARQIYHQILDQKIRLNGQTCPLGIDQSQSGHWPRLIEELL